MDTQDTGFYTFYLPVKQSKYQKKGYGTVGLPPGIHTARRTLMDVPDVGEMLVYDPYPKAPCRYGELCGHNCFKCNISEDDCNNYGGGDRL